MNGTDPIAQAADSSPQTTAAYPVDPWPPSGGFPVVVTEMGPVLNPFPYGSTQGSNINTSPPAPPHPYKSTFFPQAMPKGANGQNQGGAYQLPPTSKPWEVGPIKASPSISAISPTPIMGPGAQGTPPY
jgi:hypothetical protein